MEPIRTARPRALLPILMFSRHFHLPIACTRKTFLSTDPVLLRYSCRERIQYLLELQLVLVWKRRLQFDEYKKFLKHNYCFSKEKVLYLVIDWMVNNYRLLSRSHQQVRSFLSGKKVCRIYKISLLMHKQQRVLLLQKNWVVTYITHERRIVLGTL